MCSNDFSWKHFLLCNSLLDISSSTQAIKFKFGRNEFSKRTAAIYRQDVFIVTISRNQVDKIIGQLHLSKRIPNVSFELSCHVMSGNW